MREVEIPLTTLMRMPLQSDWRVTASSLATCQVKGERRESSASLV